MRNTFRFLADRLDSTLWFIPGLCLAVAIGLSYAAEEIDSHLGASRSNWFLFGGGPEGARELFSAVTTSMLTFTGLVFSITILVLQSASNQFSPRALRTFLKDRVSKLALGVFIGTFVYALLGLRLVRMGGPEEPAFVPALSVWLTVPMVLFSVAMFIAYLHHISQSIRAVEVIRRLAEDTRGSLDSLYPEGLGEDAAEDPRAEPPRDPPRRQIRYRARSGMLVVVDEERLVRLVEEAGVTAALRFRVGEFVPIGAALFDLWDDDARVDEAAFRRCVTISAERTMVQDTRYGFRQLVDVAARALSPAMNDPTTAVEVLDQLHDLLRRLVERRFPDPHRRIGDRVRLILPRPEWGDYVALALDEIQDWGADSIQVRGRIRLLLEDLLEAAPEFRRGPLLRQLERAERAEAGRCSA